MNARNGPKHMPRFQSFSASFAVVALLALSACASRYSAPVADIESTPRYIDSGRTHRVNGGETLYVVAWMYDLDVNALARVNNLREPYNIEPGQVLSVDLRGTPGAVATTTARPAAVGNATVTPAAVATGIRRAPLDSTPLTRQSLPSTPLPDSTAPSTPPSTPLPQATAPASPPAVARVEPEPLPERQLPPPTQRDVPATTPAPSATVTPPPVADAPVPAVVIPPPASEPEPELPSEAVANGSIAWAWPARGNIIGRYSDTDPDNKGIKLAGTAGDPVLAAADGEVVYTGNGLLRYGELVILKHNDHFLSAYAHNRVINVKEGDRVRRGTKIAELGSTGIDRDMLHFEIRLDGKPVDPMTYLPPR